MSSTFEKRKGITAERVRELLNYDPDTGILTCKVSRRGISAGKKAGSKAKHGYVQLSIDRVHCLGHRIAWLHYFGRWPTDQLDHINGVRDDNRISNLREATSSEQHQNKAKSVTRSSSKHIGVYASKRAGAWCAQITVDGRQKHLGTFDDEEAASKAYADAKAEMHSFQPKLRDSEV